MATAFREPLEARPAGTRRPTLGPISQ